MYTIVRDANRAPNDTGSQPVYHAKTQQQWAVLREEFRDTSGMKNLLTDYKAKDMAAKKTAISG